MPDTAVAIQRLIEIDGSELAPDLDAQLESVLVVDRLAMPDMFALAFRDPDRNVLGQAGIEIGAKVTVSTTSTSDDSPKPLIDAEVTSIETEYDALGTRAVVRGYDRSHRLAAGRKTATYLNVKYSDIASQVAGEAGLTPDVDETEGTFDHVFQTNQSHLEFLTELARKVGFTFRVDGETLLFKKPVESSSGPAEGDASSEEPTQLVWGRNLLDFRGRMSAVAQVGKVEVRGWDPVEKAEVVGTADATATNAELSTTAADLAGKVGGETLVVVDHVVSSQQAADQLARSRAEQVGSAAFEATAVAVGSPDLKAGTAVSIANVDPSLAGKWVISASRHEFGNGIYRTALEFSGRQDRSIHGLLTHGSGSGVMPRVPGVVTALVTDNKDPQKMGRVKLKYPWLSADAESDWARISAPGAGKGSGVVWVPQSGDEVLVAFEQGDLGRPIVLGGMWNGKDTIPFEYDDDLDAGSVTYCGFTSRTGHKISFFESAHESKIHLLTQGGSISIVLDEQNKEIKIETSGKVTIDAQQDIEIKTQGNFKVEATGVEIKASGQAAIKGATVALN
jgi:phage protein D